MLTRKNTPRFRPQFETLEDRRTPATINVTTFADVVNPNDGVVSLREAITRANANDTIQLEDGTYKITRAGPGEDANATGDFDITKPLTIVGKGASATTIDGGGLDRLFDVHGPQAIAFSKLTLRKGATSGSGGAIQALDPGNIIILTDCTVKGNTAGLAGGGINAETINLINTTVKDNTGEQGGGISAFTTANLTNSTVSGNKALTEATRRGLEVEGGSHVLGGGISAKIANLNSSKVSGNKTGGSGGGIFAFTVNLTNSIVKGNEASSAGGITAGTAATVINSTVADNTGWRGIGGLHANELTLIRSTVSGNFTAGHAGGVSAGRANLTNSTVSGNVAGFSGGGVYLTQGSILNCTIVHNQAGENGGNGGGLYNSSPYSTVHVKNTIIAKNLVLPAPPGSSSQFFGIGPDVYSVYSSALPGNNIISDGHNLIGIADGSSSFRNGVLSDQVGTKAAPLDPKLGSLANNGGPTLTHALLSGSPAINRGDNNGAPTTDQRGAIRLPGVVDIGAFEFGRRVVRFPGVFNNVVTVVISR